MFKKWYSLSVSLGLLLLGLFTFAPAPRALHAADAMWRARYWNNTTMSGAPVFEREEAEINHEWGERNAPAPGVNVDNFSVEWKRNVNFGASGTYRFTAVMDDGMRVWVGDQLLIDSWTTGMPRTVTAERYLTAGEHHIRVTYFDALLNATAKLSWQLVNTNPPPVTINNWKGEYFNNIGLAGTPVLVRDDANIAFNWGSGSPAAGIPSDNFSVRWTRNVSFAPGTYIFSATTDDGVRLWVNNQLVIDRWVNQNSTTHAAEVTLGGGIVPVRMEYYENGGGATAHLSWTRSPGSTPIANWRGEYFSNPHLAGSPVAVRDDAQINFNWSDGSPMSGMHRDNFSVRWTRNMNFSPGRYRFTITSDDGARLWVNNRLLVDQWYPHAAQSFSGEIDLAGGTVPLKIEYFENTGFAQARLSWTKLGNGGTGTGGIDPNAGTATVTAYALNVRSGPGTSYSVITSVPRNTVLTMLGYRTADSSWIMVGLSNSRQGWVHSSYVVPSKPISNLTIWTGQGGTTPPPAGTATGTVTAYHLNVRSGPGTGYAIQSVVDNGTLLVLNYRNSASTWLRVTLPNGVQGWVYGHYVRSATPFGSLPVWSN